MSFSAPDPVISGHVYRIVSINGSLPWALEQFIGKVSFAVLNYGAASARICGEGSTHGDGVRFQQKDVDTAGKDVRVWQIAVVDGDFTATPTAAF